jgi:hypothetical protein
LRDYGNNIAGGVVDVLPSPRSYRLKTIAKDYRKNSPQRKTPGLLHRNNKPGAGESCGTGKLARSSVLFRVTPRFIWRNVVLYLA